MKMSRPDLVMSERSNKRHTGYYIVLWIKIMGIILIVLAMLYFSVKGAN